MTSDQITVICSFGRCGTSLLMPACCPGLLELEPVAADQPESEVRW